MRRGASRRGSRRPTVGTRRRPGPLTARVIACRFALGGFDEPHHGQIAVVDADTGERRILTAALDRNCAPYPPLREPIWEGESLLFSLEDRGSTHLYRVRADGTGVAEPVVDGELALTGYDAAGGGSCTPR